MPRSVKTLWLLLGLLLCLPVQGGVPAHRDATLAFISIAELPPEARDTLRLIKQGGPFPYSRDGVVFGNYEKLLPPKPRGYYHEYTVKTPEARNRGARRIVCGLLPEGSPGKGRERDETQGARSGMAETYHEGRRENEHRATQQFARTATLPGLPECYYTTDHYKTFQRIRE